jgi:hypothetical protein
MNQTVEKIARTTWTEPRHFFFWLAVVCLAGFVGVIAATGLTTASSTLALVAVGCGLCFALSLVCFIIAWIPPLRRLLERLLAHRFLVLGCLLTLVALVYAVENWRGRRAWQNFKLEREARGDRLNLANLLPPPVIEERNFFNTPLWNDLRFVRTNDRVLWSDTNWGNHIVFTAFGPGNGNAPSTGNWAKSHRVNLAAWQAFYRGTNNLFPSSSGALTNFFPVAREPQTPAADVLLALSKFNENRQVLIASANRPQARFWINYDDGPGMMLPHLSRLKSAIQYLSLHANAALKAGEKQTALEDLKLQFRLLDSIRSEPILISQLVRIAGFQIALQSVWEGLADRQWNENDLSFLQSQLDVLDFLEDYRAAMRGELGCQLWVVDYVHKRGLGAWEQLAGSDHEGSSPDELMRFLGKGAFQLIPSGWFDQSKLSMCRIHDEFILSAVDQKGGVVAPSRVKQSEFAFGNRHWGLYDTFAKMVLPAYGRAIQRFARGQASLELARLGCALERYRLANGQFPETLEALTPRFIRKVPMDVINGGALKYERVGDDQFTLYSVGWNERDDGGQISLARSGSQDQDQGDWVWQYSGG